MHTARLPAAAAQQQRSSSARTEDGVEQRGALALRLIFLVTPLGLAGVLPCLPRLLHLLELHPLLLQRVALPHHAGQLLVVQEAHRARVPPLVDGALHDRQLERTQP